MQIIEIKGERLLRTEGVPRCPICSSPPSRPWTNGQDYELETSGDWWQIQCCDPCHHLWLDPRPHTDELGAIYPENYYAYNYEKSVPLVARKAKEVLDARKLAPILRLADSPPESFLDVGCGTGRYLRLMRKRGLEASRIFGLELSSDSVTDLKREGFSAFCSRVEDCQEIPEGTVDLITMFHVLEHVDAPAKVLKKLRSWLSNDGMLVLETPNFQSLDGRLFQNRFWGGYHFPRHWNLFSPSSLAKLLNQEGFEIQSVRYQTGHAFWMWSFHHWLTYGKGLNRIGKFFHPLSGALPLLAAFTAFDLVRSRLGFATSAMLVVAKLRGQAMPVPVALK